ncbi:MAG: histidine kinase [Bacteroidota bacterium]|jgi:two-component system, LytTR family, sensor kinase
MKLKYKIIIHTVFWLYIFNQAIFPYFTSSKEMPFLVPDLIIHMLTGMVSFYVFFFSFSFLFGLKNKLLSILTGFALAGGVLAARIGMEYPFWKYLVHYDMSKMNLDREWVFNDIRLILIFFIYSLLIRLAINWYENQKLQADFTNQKQISELALLRSQVNPHFFFNTLNNIYSLVYQKSDDAPEAVMKLSSIMRYMLYDATTDKVLLDKEIEYLKSFIELEKLRLRNKDFVSLTINGASEGKTIAPMILIPFVENAFKHASRSVPAPGIMVTINVESGEIVFGVKNYIRKNQHAPNDKQGGIGLINIRRRLELLYPQRYSLNINTAEDVFIVKLTIRN